MFKSLLRTLPTLSGNFSICCKLNDYNKITSNDYEVCVRDASILSLQDNQYNNEVSINLAKESYEFIIAKYYGLCSNVFYKENYLYNKDSYQEYDKYEVNSNNDARNKDYEFGCKRLHYSYNGYQFNFYAPFYINDGDSLPDYFLLSIYMTDKLVKNIKIFIDKEDSNNYLRKFLRKYCNNLDSKVIFCLPESKQATYFGINVKDGGFGQYIDNEFGNLYNTQNTINNFDYTICKGFERNNLIMKQIIPLSFSFNINDLFDDYEKKIFSFDKIKIIGRYYNKFDTKEDFYDFSIDYNTFYCKYNKYTSNGNYELDFGYDDIGDKINIMNIGYPSLNESKFVKYRYTNKITPKYCRFKLTNSNEENPYIINMSYAYSNTEEDNDKYGEFPTMFKDIFPESIVEENNLLLPIGKKYTNAYIEYDYLNYLKYKKLMTNFYSSWFNIFKENTSIFDNIYEWSDVLNNHSYFKGILYNFKNEDIDKFALFINPKLNYLSNDDAKTTIINAAYIYDIKRTDIDFIEMNKLSYDHSYNLENNKGTIDVTANIDLDSKPASYSLLYKFDNEEIFNIDNLMNPKYYEEVNDINYNEIHFNLEGDITYTNKFFSKSNNSDYVAINKNIIKDINGDYIYVDKYFKRNLYYKVKDIKQLIKNSQFDIDEINLLLNEYINHNTISGFELIRINSNNNIYDSDGNIAFENMGITDSDTSINDLYVVLKGSSEKIKLLSIIDKIKNNKAYYQSLSIFKSCELLEKESLFNFLYKSLKIKNIKYSNNEKDINSYIKILYDINMKILDSYIIRYFSNSKDIPFETLRNIILDIIDQFYPYYEVTYKTAEIINEYLYEYNTKIQTYYSIHIKNLLNDYNYLASILRKNIEYLKYGDTNIENNEESITHNLNLYNKEKSYSLLAFLYYDLSTNITSYNYVPYSINSNKDIIKDYYTKNETFINNSIYVDSFNLNTLIYQYNCQYNYTKKNKQFVNFIEDNSRIYEIEEKYGEFLNLDHIKEYVNMLHNDENFKWDSINIEGKKSYISVINNIYVKERVWIIENNELIYKDKYTILAEYLKNINTDKCKYKYINDILIVNNVYNGFNNPCELNEETNEYTYINYWDEHKNEDPKYEEQYYKYANEIFYNLMCSSLKNENNRFVIKLDNETSIELTLAFKKKFVKLNDSLLNILANGYYMYLYTVNYDSLNNDNWNYEKNIENLNIEPIENFISPLFTNIYMNEYDVDSIHNMISKNKIINNKYSNNNQNIFMYIDIYEYFKDYLIKNSINENGYDKFTFINKYISNDLLIKYIFDLAKNDWNKYASDNNININVTDVNYIFNECYKIIKDKYAKHIQINQNLINEFKIIFATEYDDSSLIDYDNYEEINSILKTIYNNINSVINNKIGEKNNSIFKNFFDYKYVIEYDENKNEIYNDVFFERIFNDTFINNIINIYIDKNYKYEDYKDYKIDEEYFRNEIIHNYIGIDLYSIYNTNMFKYNKDLSYDRSKYELIETSSNLNILLDKETHIKYGLFMIDFEFDNTNNSLNIMNQYNITSSFETINGKELNNKNYIVEIFRSINPFFKENIFKLFTLDNSNYIIFPNELDINIIYNSIKLNKDEEYKYTMIKEYDNDQLYENIIKLNKYKKLKLLRYFNYIDPHIIKTNVINNLWETKFIENNDYSNKYNILYKSNVSINQYNGIYLCNDYDNVKHIDNRHNIVNQYEYKHYNDNSLYNLNEEIIITIDKLVEYDDIINIYQTPERTYEEFKKYINKINKNIDDLNIILFLYNKYNVSYSSEHIKLDSTKSKKLYKISYKFNLK